MTCSQTIPAPQRHCQHLPEPFLSRLWNAARPRIVPPVVHSVTAVMILAYVDSRRARTSLRRQRMTVLQSDK